MSVKSETSVGILEPLLSNTQEVPFHIYILFVSSENPKLPSALFELGNAAKFAYDINFAKFPDDPSDQLLVAAVYV